MKVAEQPKLKFDSFFIVRANFEMKNHESRATELHDLSVSMKATEDFFEDKKFSILFNVIVESTDGDVHVDVDAITYFSTAEVIDEVFKTSDFVKMNAPAIIFPYLRAFISSLTVNSNFSPIILPTYNFTSLLGKNKPKDLPEGKEKKI
jgi:preprotein translocase subunit SecB